MKPVFSLQVTPLVGISVKDSVREAMRLAQLMGVLVKYTFNDAEVCVSRNGLQYAVDIRNYERAAWFHDRLTDKR